MGLHSEQGCKLRPAMLSLASVLLIVVICVLFAVVAFYTLLMWGEKSCSNKQRKKKSIVNPSIPVTMDFVSIPLQLPHIEKPETFYPKETLSASSEIAMTSPYWQQHENAVQALEQFYGYLERKPIDYSDRRKLKQKSRSQSLTGLNIFKKASLERHTSDSYLQKSSSKDSHVLKNCLLDIGDEKQHTSSASRKNQESIDKKQELTNKKKMKFWRFWTYRS